MARFEEKSETQVSSRQTEDTTPFRHFYAAARAAEAAVALWRLPATGAIYGVVDLDQVNRLDQIDFRRARSGFVFAPFVNGAKNAALRIDADAMCTAAGLVLPQPADSQRRQRRQARFADAFAQVAANRLFSPAGWYTPRTKQSGIAATEGEFTALVSDAVEFIRETSIAKVVVSRMADRTLPAAFDPVTAFLELSVRYPHALTSLVAIPGVGTWLGASPEVLLTLDEHALTTMALAGTQRRPEDRPLAEVRWGHKESIEQEMVSDYIGEFFVRAGVGAVTRTEPQTVAAGNVVHLQTVFTVDLPEPERFALANRVLDELHPTSAVCGMPKHKALAFILDNERYDRSFYSGFLGPVHVDGHSSLYVNLRCMQLLDRTANLYVGAGITADSDPAAEWRETEMKAETILSVLHQQ